MKQNLDLQDVLSNLIDKIEKGVDIEQRSFSEPISVEIDVAVEEKEGGGVSFGVPKLLMVDGKVTGKQTSQMRVSMKFYPKDSQKTQEEIASVVAQNLENRERW